ncbi:MAG TPA: hypothetical protein VFO42_02755 [Sphingomicrobium sp.]|nr:hypothetical protein [Sphingomicrobium sp.]
MKQETAMKIITTMFVAAGCLGLAACDVDQTQEGEMPEVEVNATGGQMPEFDVDGPTVNVGTENKTIEVPTVDVDAPQDDNRE